jgi:hydroxymethylglutaryl-CoA synthase
MESKDVGIDDIALYLPETKLDMTDTYAEATETDPAKYSEGLGVEEMMLPDTYEDAATMAAEAAYDLMRENDLDPENMDRLAVATESSWDGAKSIATYVAGMLEDVVGEDRLRGATQTEHKFACLAGTHALHDAANQLHVEGGDDAYSIVIASDTAWYERGSSGEPTQGAGAVAMLVADDPDVAELGTVRGTASSDETDFLKPEQYYPAVDGQRSQEVYLDHIEDALDELGASSDLDAVDSLAVHTPFPHMVEKAAPLIEERTDFEADDLDEAIDGSIALGRHTGNLYTGSVHLARLSTLLTQEDPEELLVTSYGSGAGAEASRESIVDGFEDALSTDLDGIQDQIDVAKELSWEEYEQLHATHNPNREETRRPLTTPRGFVRTGTGEMGERTYAYIPSLAAAQIETDGFPD